MHLQPDGWLQAAVWMNPSLGAQVLQQLDMWWKCHVKASKCLRWLPYVFQLCLGCFLGTAPALLSAWWLPSHRGRQCFGQERLPTLLHDGLTGGSGQSLGVRFYVISPVNTTGWISVHTAVGKKKPQLIDVCLTMERLNHLSSNFFPLYISLLFSCGSTLALCEPCILDFLLWVV